MIAEMLQQTTGLYAKTKGATVDGTGGFTNRPEALFQLGVNYRWSSIVSDTRVAATASTIDLDELKVHAYGGYDDSLAAGDRAPDAPGLVHEGGGETRLFDLFDVTRHTVLLFLTTSDSRKAAITSTLQIMKTLPADTVQSVILSSPSTGSQSDMVPSADRVLTDGQGHAFAGYKVSDGDDLTIVVVRPDVYIGAIVRTAEELQSYFSRVFTGA